LAQKQSHFAHQYRLNAVVRIVDALLNGGRLSLTHLGRHRPGHSYVKHQIKAIARLLDNRKLHAERVNVYAAFARRIILNIPRSLVIDWAACVLDRKLLIHRASISLGDRAYTLNEEVHPLRRHNNPINHRRFLERPHRIIPEHVSLIVVVNAPTENDIRLHFEHSLSNGYGSCFVAGKTVKITTR
jgi:hypothetical protein